MLPPTSLPVQATPDLDYKSLPSTKSRSFAPEHTNTTPNGLACLDVVRDLSTSVSLVSYVPETNPCGRCLWLSLTRPLLLNLKVSSPKNLAAGNDDNYAQQREELSQSTTCITVSF